MKTQPKKLINKTLKKNDRKKIYHENSKPNKSEKKTLESPLDYKEIKLVSPKGNQSQIFNRRTDAEA